MEGIQYGIQQGYNPMATAGYGSQPYASQYGPQGFGGAGSSLGGVIGSGIPGLLGGQNTGRQPGQVADGFGGVFQPYGSVDPVTAAHVHTQLQLLQLAQQAQLAQLAQQAQVAQQLAQQQQLGRLSPFGLDPISAAIAQQRAQFSSQPQFAPWTGVNPLNRIDPITAAYIQQAQIAQLFQQLALQGQQPSYAGQPSQLGQFGHNPFGQGQLNQPWLGGQNPWISPRPFPYGQPGGQLPVY